MSLLFSLTAAAFTPDTCPFGVNAHQVSDAELGLAADAGIRHVRFDLNWYQVELQPGVYDWSIPDRFIDTSTAEGLDVFVTIAYSPIWATPGCNEASTDLTQWCRNRVPSEAQWTSFVTAAVSRYGDDVKHWGLWNEPNLLQFWQGSRDAYVDTILVPGSEAVHDACPDCKVVGPELAGLRSSSDWDQDQGQCLFGECRFNGWNHSLNAILSVAGDSIDIVSHHKYSDDAATFWNEALNGQWIVIQLTQGIQEITNQHTPGKPVWITETGMETDPGGDFTQAAAADELEALYAAIPAIRDGSYNNAPAWPELERVYWYDLTDSPVDGWDGAYTWGLLHSDLTPKLGYHAYADIFDDLGGCDELPPPSSPPPSAPPTSPASTPPTSPPTPPPTSPPTAPDPAPEEPGASTPGEPEDSVGTPEAAGASGNTGCSTSPTSSWQGLLRR